jgi:iron(III) transport system substrate-binding protein
MRHGDADRTRERVVWQAGLAAAVAVCVLLAGCPSRRSDEEILVTVTENGDHGNAVAHDKIVEQARAEGELNWYTSLPGATAKTLLAQFQKTYPFIQTHLVRSSTFEVARQTDTEIKSGKVQCDVLHVLDVAAFIDLKRRGELYRYVSSEDKAIPEAYKDPGYWTAMRAVTLCMAYDTRRLKAQEAPKSWEDLTDPKWRGKLGLKDAALAGTAYTEYYFLRDLYGMSYWRKLAEQNPRVFRTAGELMDALVAGQITVASGVTGAGVYQASRVRNQPVAAIIPSEGLPMMLGPVAIAADAPHPNCAKLFVDFALSSEVQASLCALSASYSVRADVPPPEGQPPLSKLKILQPTGGWDAYYQAQDALQAEYARFFRGGRHGAD